MKGKSSYSIFMLANTKDMSEKLKKQPIEVTELGSLGLFAIGDLGLRAWRKVKKEAKLKRENEKEE
ncbi:hypothetical protein [Lacinutrix sp. Bg11-31]|uniref:hypothetical protein n=1 Tax=Lacinutrix sp. Bg11-31 TaxID=2057808 RepID=UPI0012FDD532|nr:hypothetical protein [Lacinutrix sp. Bg11-31]